MNDEIENHSFLNHNLLLINKIDVKIQTSIPNLVENSHHHHLEEFIAPVAWIIIASEGLHNFIGTIKFIKNVYFYFNI